MRLLAFLALLACCAFPAWAQLRTIPGEAARAEMRHLQDSVVEIDGRPVRLSPGAQIRDVSNRIVLPASMLQPALVRYLLDATGAVHRVWILSPQEAAAS